MLLKEIFIGIVRNDVGFVWIVCVCDVECVFV